MENINIGKHRNCLLDAIKGLACFAVVFMHVKFPGNLGGVITIISSFAVPVFFMTSGFYAVGKNRGGVQE